MTQPDRTQLDFMRKAIRALSEPTQSVYRLHLIDGLEYPAIARRLGLRLDEVEDHIARAIVLIDRALRGHC